LESEALEYMNVNPAGFIFMYVPPKERDEGNGGGRGREGGKGSCFWFFLKKHIAIGRIIQKWSPASLV